MARSYLTNPTDDLITDSGAVLFSFVKGEQLEFPITLTFIDDAENGYGYEAVVVEGNNVANQEEPPNRIKEGGIQTVLTVRVPEYVGVWSDGGVYLAEDIVSYEGKYYKRVSSMTVAESTTPNTSTLWQQTTRNKVYVQFPSTLASTWSQAPIVEVPVYGFFELRVTEPNTATFRRTWKPVRGMIQILFSPTDIVPDV